MFHSRWLCSCRDDIPGIGNGKVGCGGVRRCREDVAVEPGLPFTNEVHFLNEVLAQQRIAAVTECAEIRSERFSKRRVK